ncbi:alpha/beta hydrolase [Halorussus salilacus]|uniref:alpha/beta hydrolase n=1 Tax=Halorussus salilacus TaxID=2953750 RepID=UPI00209CC5B8|nr:alpha/beta hydrolase [Halorussus salilacus]USZ69058.1 alpha/beta hydrolase [Halorussus salilacus]
MSFDRRQFLKHSATTIAGSVAFAGATGTAAASDVPTISTRDHFDDDADLVTGETATSYDTSGDVPGVDTGCTDDVTVFVHGWDKKSDSDDAEQAAHDKISHADSQLRANGYDGTVVGYTWDSDKGGGVDYGWYEAEDIAQQNGAKLAQFAVDFAYACPNARLRFASHSLGAQVVLSALRSLNGSWFTDNGHEVYSIHLLGAAQDNEAPTTEWMDTYDAITEVVTGAFNYHSHEDDTLQWIYNVVEFDQALGETGYESGNTPAPNYTEYDGTSQVGDDHSGYLDHLSDEVVYHMEHVGDYV